MSNANCTGRWNCCDACHKKVVEKMAAGIEAARLDFEDAERRLDAGESPRIIFPEQRYLSEGEPSAPRYDGVHVFEIGSMGVVGGR